MDNLRTIAGGFAILCLLAFATWWGFNGDSEQQAQALAAQAYVKAHQCTVSQEKYLLPQAYTCKNVGPQHKDAQLTVDELLATAKLSRH